MKDKKQANAAIQGMRDVLPDRHPLHRQLDALARFTGELRRENQKLKSRLADADLTEQTASQKCKEATAAVDALRLELEHEKALRQQAMTSIMKLEKEFAELHERRRKEASLVKSDEVTKCRHRKEIMALSKCLMEDIPGYPEPLVRFESDEPGFARMTPIYGLENIIDCMAPSVNKYLTLGQYMVFMTRCVGYCCVISNHSAYGPSQFTESAQYYISKLMYRAAGWKGRSKKGVVFGDDISDKFEEESIPADAINEIARIQPVTNDDTE